MTAASSARLILASRSPRRRELLAQAGYEFDVLPAAEAAECGVCSRETPPEMAARLACQKAADVVRQLAAATDDRTASKLVLGCDTVVECAGRILGKPRDRDHARWMLDLLRGREHHVYTGVCLWPVGGSPRVEVARTTLRMDWLSDEQISEYLESELWEGKAGAFGYQDRQGWLNVIEGSESNVVGLPIELLTEMLAALLPAHGDSPRGKIAAGRAPTPAAPFASIPPFASTPPFTLAAAYDWQPQPDVVDVFRLDGLGDPSLHADFWPLLSDDERQRAAQFLHPRKQTEFVIARGLLRTLLGRALGEPPEQLPLWLSPHGKPESENRPGGARLEFNLAHSNNVLLVALTIGRPVGVDVEWIRPTTDCDRLARHVYSAHEQAELAAVPSEGRRVAFFTLWARKEAIIKAVGRGLALGLDRFDVSLGEPPRLLAARWDPAVPATWSLADLDVGSEYRAAVALAGGDFAVRCWRA